MHLRKKYMVFGWDSDSGVWLWPNSNEEKPASSWMAQVRFCFGSWSNHFYQMSWAGSCGIYKLSNEQGLQATFFPLNFFVRTKKSHLPLLRVLSFFALLCLEASTTRSSLSSPSWARLPQTSCLLSESMLEPGELLDLWGRTLFFLSLSILFVYLFHLFCHIFYFEFGYLSCNESLAMLGHRSLCIIFLSLLDRKEICRDACILRSKMPWTEILNRAEFWGTSRLSEQSWFRGDSRSRTWLAGPWCPRWRKSSTEFL